MLPTRVLRRPCWQAGHRIIFSDALSSLQPTVTTGPVPRPGAPWRGRARARSHAPAFRFTPVGQLSETLGAATAGERE